MHLQFFLFLVCAFGTCIAQEDKCPKTSISPCTCKTYYDGSCYIACGLTSQEQLEKLANIPNLCGGYVHFFLVNSKVSGIPAKLWKNLLSSKTVDIAIKHVVMDGLIPPGSEDIPEVYTSGSAVIKLDHCRVKNWDWKQLKKFYSEEELTIVIDDTPMPEISTDFAHIANGQVHKVSIDSTGLTSVPDKLFVAFDDLNSLSLQNNKLTSVSRSMISKPANKLEFLHLNGNLLTSIPGDLFSDMPVLSVVYLRDNRITTLPQDLFENISSPNFKRVDFINNPWDCNCRLMWILSKKKQHASMGVCATPEELAKKKVRSLSKLLDC
ncbi:Leucine-rich repeat transmembrane protein FLRT1, partial [Stegodyphus mimosarum]